MDPDREVDVSCWIKKIVSRADSCLFISSQDSDKQFCNIQHSGRGKWKEIATLIPSRSTVQVKTHAQMVMKRVEAGEDVFEDLRHLTTEQSTEVLRDDCKSIPTTSAMNVKIKSNRSCRDKVMKPFQAYDTLTRRDQGAVMILCQMWKTR